MRDPDLVEAERRLGEACAIISGAIRLGRLDGGEVYRAVRDAVDEGADRLAKDIKDEYRSAAR